MKLSNQHIIHYKFNLKILIIFFFIKKLFCALYMNDGHSLVILKIKKINLMHLFKHFTNFKITF